MIKNKSASKFQMAIVAIVAILTICSTSWAATYYVDATKGNDNNDGRSPTTAWRTIAKVNLSRFQPGDQILFERGDVWREQLTIPSSGSSGNSIIFGAYGSGAKPAISGADIFSNWTSEVVDNFKVYFTSAASEAKQLFEDGSRLKRVGAKNALTAGTWWQDPTSQKIFIRTAGDDHPSGHTIEASLREFGIWIQNKSYITVENIKMESTNDKGLDIFSYWENVNQILIRNIVSSHNYHMGLRSTGMNGRRINNVVIEDSVFNFNGADGIMINGDSDNFTIRRNTVHNNCILETPGDTELDWTGGIRAIGSSIDYVTFEDNMVYANGKLNGNPVVIRGRGYGIWFDTIGTGGIMRRNTIYDNYQEGIRIEVTSRAEVYYNISYGNGHAGISIARGVHNNKIYNNVSYNNEVGIRLRGDDPAQDDNCTGNIVKNNIAVNNTWSQLEAWNGCANDGTWGYNNVYEYNCFGFESDHFIIYGYAKLKDTYDAWETAYGGNTYSIQSDPLFTNPDNFQFTLRLGSPAIDAGKDVGLTQDFNKTSIPQFEGTDVGAFEYILSPPENFRPLLP